MQTKKEKDMEQECPNFTAAVRALGATRRARAAQLKCDPKTVDRLMDRLPESLKIFRARPDLLRALADDLERLLDTQDCPN